MLSSYRTCIDPGSKLMLAEYPFNAMSECASKSNASLPMLPPSRRFALTLHALQHCLLELAVLHLLSRVIGGGLTMKREQVAEIEFGCLELLDLANVNLVIN